MDLLVTGASGLLGSAVVPVLSREGWRVVPARRGAAGPGEARWDPASGEIAHAGRVEAVLHLAGAGLAERRWSPEVRRVIRSSRVQVTRALSERLARRSPPPAVLVAASAVGFYGDRGDEVLDEGSARGRGFLAELAEAWEEACEPAASAGIRVVHLRFGVVLSRRGGALGKLLLPFRLGIGGPLGSGRQFWSWIGIEDVTAVVVEALRDRRLSGPVNVVAPEPVRQRDLARTLGRVLHRPAAMPAPAALLRLVLGRMADEMLLASGRVRPARLEATGFRWRHPGLEDALRAALGPGG